MELKLYQIDAFAQQHFTGNPAAVCPLDAWLDDELMQAIAEENNLAETAFFVPNGSRFELRWFTPATEVDLCGHATLASAYVLFNELGHTNKPIRFNTRSGELVVTQQDGQLAMDLPASLPHSIEPPPALLDAFPSTPREVLAAEDYLAVFDNAEAIRSMQPDLFKLKQLDRRGVIITAAADDDERSDFVCRFFAPNYGIDEDPVTGSAFCQLAPYWSEQFGRHELSGRQLSQRGGMVHCQWQRDVVTLTGHCVKYLEGVINVDIER